MVRTLLAMELRKAFSGRWFWLAFSVACAIALLDAASTSYYELTTGSIGIEYADTKYYPFSVDSCFVNWISMDAGQPMANLFYLLLPLLASLPYAWSLRKEIDGGYLQNVLTRAKSKDYFASKYAAIFVSSGAAVAMPLVLNFLVCACVFPMRVPDVFDMTVACMPPDGLFSAVFYNNPMLHVVLVILISFVFAGLWGTAIASFSLVVKNRLAYTLLPFLFLFLLEYLNLNFINHYGFLISLTPFEYLRGGGAPMYPHPVVMTVEYVFLLAVSTVSLAAVSKRDAL